MHVVSLPQPSRHLRRNPHAGSAAQVCSTLQHFCAVHCVQAGALGSTGQPPPLEPPEPPDPLELPPEPLDPPLPEPLPDPPDPLLLPPPSSLPSAGPVVVLEHPVSLVTATEAPPSIAIARPATASPLRHAPTRPRASVMG
jgi:hypothetical protein